MKKILALLATISLTSLASASVVACGFTADVDGRQFFKVDLKAANSLESLTRRINSEFLSYEKLNLIVREELIKLLQESENRNPNASFDLILGRDYAIEKPTFKTNGDLLHASRILISAPTNSRFFTGSYSITAFTNLNYLTKDYAAFGNYYQGEQYLKNLESQLRDLPFKADYRVTKESNGSWHLYADPDGLVELDFEYLSRKSDISDMHIPSIKVNTNDTKVRSIVVEALQAKYEQVFHHTDFEIEGPTGPDNLAISNGGGYIQVKATEASKMLTGSFKVFVEKVDLTDFKLATPLSVLNNETTIRQTIIQRVNQLHPELRISSDDFDLDIQTVVSPNSRQRVVKVITNVDSKLVSGTFEFNLEKVSINSKNFDSEIFVGIEGHNSLLNYEIQRELNELLVVNGESMHTISSAEYTVVPSLTNKRVFEIEANETSEWITGTASTKLKQVDLSTDLNLTDSMLKLVVGQRTSSAIDPIVAAIKQKVSWAKLGEDFEIINEYGTYATETGDIIIRPGASSIFAKEIRINVVPKQIETTLTNRNLGILELDNLNTMIVEKLKSSFITPANILINNQSFAISNEQGELVNFNLSANWKAGTYFVKPTSLGEKVWTGELIFVVEKASFSNTTINVEPIEVGDNFDAKIQNVLAQIQKLVPTVLNKNVDYEIIDSSNEGKVKGTVEIRAKADSKLIQGSTSFEVKTVNVSGKVDLDVNQSIQWSDLKAQIRQKIKTTIFANKDIEISDRDFNNIKLNQLEDSDLVMPGSYIFTTTNSQIISGTFIVKVDVTSMSNVTIGNKNYQLDEVSTIEDEILGQLQNLYNAGTGIEVQRNDFVIKDSTTNQIISFADTKNWNGGTYLVEPSVKGKALFKDSFKISVDKITLSDELVHLDNLVVGDDYQAQIKQFTDILNSQVNGLTFVEGVDYKINDLSNGALKTGKVTITTTGSKRLAGSISFNVEKKTIKDVEINRPFVKTTWNEISKIVQNEIQKSLFGEDSQVLVKQTDFEILGKMETDEGIALPGNYMVQAKPTSQIITGSFELEVGTLEINNEWVKVADIFVGDDYQKQIDTALEQIAKVLNQELVEGIDYRILNPTQGGIVKGEITIESIETSHLINGNVVIKVLPKTITGPLPSFNRNNVDEIYQGIKAHLQDLFDDSVHSITVSDTDFVILDANNKTLDIMSPAGKYVVQAAKNSKILTGQTNGDTTKFDLSSLTSWIEDNYSDEDRDVSYLHTPAYFEKLIQDWVNFEGLKFPTNSAKANLLIKDKDYVITGTNLTADNVLTVANTITVKANASNKFITGSFSFEITPVDLAKMDLNDFKISDAQINSRKNVAEIKEIITRDLNNKIQKNPGIEYGVDYTIDSVEDWATNNLTIKIKAVSGSNYLKNDNSVVKIKTINLETLKPLFEGLNSYEQGITIFGKVKDDVSKILNAEFKNAWVIPEYDVDYTIETVNVGDSLPSSDSNVLRIIGKDVLRIKAIDSSRVFNKSVLFANVITKTLDNGQQLYDSSSRSSYVLTNASSTFSTSSEDFPHYDNSRGFQGITVANLDGTAGNRIQANQILGISKNMLATTRGIYVGPKLIAGTAGLVQADVIAVTDYYVLTTKGSYAWRNINTYNSNNWSANIPKIAGLDGLGKNDVLYFDDNIIVTSTKGIYTLNVQANKKVQGALTTTAGLSTINPNNFVKANKNFVMLNNELYRREGNVWTNILTADMLNNSKSADDIISFSDSEVLVDGWGLFPATGSVLKTEKLGEVLATSNTYTVTDEYILYNNFDINKFITDDKTKLTKADILEINNNFLITTKGIYYQGEKIDNPIYDQGISKNDVFKYNETFVITRFGIQFINKTTMAYNGFDENRVVINKNDDIKLSNRFLAVSGKGAWGTNPAGTELVTLNLYEASWTGIIFSDINDYFLISDKLTWTLNNDDSYAIVELKKTGEAKHLNLTNQYTKLVGKLLITGIDGIFWLKNAYWTSETSNHGDGTNVPWTKGDFIYTGEEGQVITKYKSWRNWQQMPIKTDGRY